MPRAAGILDSSGNRGAARVTVPWHGRAARSIPCDNATGSTLQGGIMSLQSRIETLKGRHASLELRIADEDRPRPNGDALQRLKVEKLRLKEELERLAQN